MPELPEVETIKLGLQKYLIGHTIEDIEISDNKIFQGNKKAIIGGKIEGVQRIGKGLIIYLNNIYSLAIHIKLTGQLIYQDSSTQTIAVSKRKVGTIPSKFTRVVFDLNHGAKLYYNDMRRFGWIKVVKTDEVHSLPFFKELGPEPIPSKGSGRAALTFQQFENLVHSSNLSIKVLLMDQKKIGGIGNIYANDALFVARIDPRRRAKTLTDEEIKKLFDAIHQVLNKGLESGGASELSYVNVLGQDGGYQKHFLVYGRENEPCKNGCGGIIKKFMLSGRGTYMCEKCQK
jgi:formamidopyrimidine-DNA glycosylase